MTVVTPSFNQADYLEEAIRSVLLQGYPDLEYIVMDGGSSDGSVEIIQRYEDHLSYWTSEPDRGQSHAINKGWARATGDVLAWLNSDDLYAPNAIATAVAALMDPTWGTDPPAAVYGNCRNIDAEGREFSVSRPGAFDYRRLLSGLSSYLPQPTVFARRRPLEEVGFLDETLHYSMDYDLWLRLGSRYPMRYVDQVWACTRFHAEAKTVARHAEVWQGKAAVLRKALGSPDLPQDLRAESRRIYGGYLFKTGCVSLGELAWGAAASYTVRAVATHPRLLLERRRWRQMARVAWKLARQGRRSAYWPRPLRRTRPDTTSEHAGAAAASPGA